MHRIQIFHGADFIRNSVVDGMHYRLERAARVVIRAPFTLYAPGKEGSPTTPRPSRYEHNLTRQHQSESGMFDGRLSERDMFRWEGEQPPARCPIAKRRVAAAPTGPSPKNGCRRCWRVTTSIYPIRRPSPSWNLRWDPDATPARASWAIF